jgi:hypothetical protein
MPAEIRPRNERARILHAELHRFLDATATPCPGPSLCPHEKALDAALAEERRLERERMQAMRLDYRTMPHAEFPIKWPDWRDYEEVLPTSCSCRECQLWRSGS